MRRICRSAFVMLVCLTTAQAAFADGLGGSFRSWLLGSEAQAATLDNYQPELDGVAQACLQCHNGVNDTHFTVKNANTPIQFSNSGMQVNHPVGMYYDDYAATGSRNYTPRVSLDPSVVLVDGNVTCVSCHRLKDTPGSDSLAAMRWDENQPTLAGTNSCSASAELTVGPRQTDLCLACHSM